MSIQLYPFLFRFGVSFDYNIPESCLQSLRAFLSKKYDTEISLTQEAGRFNCISIKDSEAIDNARILAYKFDNRIKEYQIETFDESLLFIDIKDAYSDKFIDSFLIPRLVEISKGIDSSTYSEIPKFVLFCDELDSSSLLFDMLFTHHASSQFLKYCLIFDKKANVIKPNHVNIEIINDLSLKTLINEFSTPSLERFSYKLVRKINHFKRFRHGTSVHIGCQKFFYEGLYCEDEIFQLIMQHLIELKLNDDFNPHYIVFDCPDSSWLKNGVNSVANSIASVSHSTTFTNYSKKQIPQCENHFDLSNGDDFRNQNEWRDENNVKLVFITDLIDSGQTFRKKIKEIQKKFPKADIKCLSVLVTEKAYHNLTGSEQNRKIVIDEFEISYFELVSQSFIFKSVHAIDCQICKYKLLPLVETSVPITKNLSSFEMWLMCEEAGYKLEDFSPRVRPKGRRIIPNSLEMFKKNGALLSLKFEQYLSINDLNKHPEIVLVFPNEINDEPQNPETYNSIDTSPSGYFAKSLNVFNPKYSYLGIPRKLIQRLQENSVDLNNPGNEFSDIFKQISNIDKPVIILDEVNFTGKTFKTIVDILWKEGKEPACYFPVFNFDAESTNKKYSEDRYSSIVFLSLYELSFVHD